MTIPQICCTIEQANQLEKLGVKGNSLFCYCHVNPSMSTSDEGFYEILPTSFDLTYPDLATTHYVDVWTVAELSVMLPNHVRSNDDMDKCPLNISKNVTDTWMVEYHKRGSPTVVYSINKNLAEALAATLIQLLIQSRITAQEVNERLTNN